MKNENNPNMFREEKDSNPRRQQIQIESQINYLAKKYPDYKDIIEDWKEKYKYGAKK